ncbi:MAG: glycoside hydrolase family 104 protein [Candidatus Babeliaceae bacterium]|nr:glycoside hydrolase family 104 protein [Candidatus Babeliaceae bacterium]
MKKSLFCLVGLCCIGFAEVKCVRKAPRTPAPRRPPQQRPRQAAPEKLSALRDRLLRLLIESAELQTFLAMISFAEGTYKNGVASYSSFFWTPRHKAPYMTSFAQHPCEVRKGRAGNHEFRSTAAGRYMILCRIWEQIARKMRLTDFGPLNQDLAATYLIYEHGALGDVLNLRIREAIKKLRPVWASFPPPYYQGQRAKPLSMLLQFFYEHYPSYREGVQNNKSTYAQWG